jgi:hypothetical protein
VMFGVEKQTLGDEVCIQVAARGAKLPLLA